MTAHRIPSSWTVVPLGSVISARKGKKPHRTESEKRPGLVPYVTIRVFESGIADQFCDPSGLPDCTSADLLVVWDGARCGLVGRAIAGVVGSTLVRIRSQFLDSRYLRFFLETQFNVLNFNPKGAGIPHVNPERFAAILLPVPPEREQRPIVDAIEAHFTRLDAAIAALERVRTNLKRYRAGVLKAAMNGFGTGTANWSSETIERLCSEIVDCPHSTPKYGEGEAFAIDTTCMEPGRMVRARLRRLSAASYDDRNRRLVPRAGDVVFAREGTVGTAVSLPPEPLVCLGQRVMLMRPGDRLNSLFLQYALMADGTRRQYAPKLGGSTVSHLNVRDVKQLAIPFPAIEEQQRIVNEIERCLSVADAIAAEVGVGLKRCGRMRQAILKKAFEGRLVMQSHADEPATRLLERMNGTTGLTPQAGRSKNEAAVPPASFPPGDK